MFELSAALGAASYAAQVRLGSGGSRQMDACSTTLCQTAAAIRNNLLSVAAIAVNADDLHGYDCCEESARFMR
jgi:hypothetical protein